MWSYRTDKRSLRLDFIVKSYLPCRHAGLELAGETLLGAEDVPAMAAKLLLQHQRQGLRQVHPANNMLNYL